MGKVGFVRLGGVNFGFRGDSFSGGLQKAAEGCRTPKAGAGPGAAWRPVFHNWGGTVSSPDLDPPKIAIT
jgi:hypothetical protein